LITVNIAELGLTANSNVGDARTIGADITASILLTEGLQLDIGGNWLDGETQSDFDDFSAGIVPKGSAIPGVPDFTYNVSLSYSRFIGNFQGIVRADYAYTGEATEQFGATTKASGFGLLNLSASIGNENWKLRVFANNVTDERAQAGFENNFVLTVPGYTYGPQYNATQPRTVGLTLSFNY